MMVRLPPLWTLLAIACGLSPVFAHAQVNTMPTVPRGASEGDVDEVDEVARDSDYLPQDEGDDEKAAFPDKAESMQLLQDEELKLSAAEIRSRYDYGVALALGTSRPWQTFGLEATYIAAENVTAGMFAGGGRSDAAGILEDKAYDMRLNSRSAGVSARYHFERIDTASVEAILGYAAWEGVVSPHGSSDTPGDAADKLSASFRAHGSFFGASAALTWLWTHGFFVEWTLVGAQKSRMTSRDLTREASLVDKVLEQTIQRASFYGLTNLKFGWLF